MSNRELVMDVVSKMPEDAPLQDILEQIEFVAGVKQGLAEAKRREGIPIEEVRELVKEWTSKSS